MDCDDGEDGDGMEGLDGGGCCCGGCCRGRLWLGDDRDGVDGIWLADGICGICGICGMGGVIGDWQAETTKAQPSAAAAVRST